MPIPFVIDNQQHYMADARIANFSARVQGKAVQQVLEQTGSAI